MPGAIETAKLRIFLALAACVDTRDELRPLPDLDFNLKVGNLVVGFKDASDVDRIGADLLTQSKLIALEPEIERHSKLYRDFSIATETSNDDVQSLKSALRNLEQELRQECDAIYAEQTRIDSASFQNWREEAMPFHWFAEFPEIVNRGGFDVIIGNPPYLKLTQLPGYSVVGYKTEKCPDLYAVCCERSLGLLAPNGRHSFIVMLNFSFSDQFKNLRNVVADRHGSEWWSTFGKRPTQLFAGARVANTVLTVGPGSVHALSRHHLFDSLQRESLFQTLEFAEFERSAGEAPVRAGILGELFGQIGKIPIPRGAFTDTSLFVRPTGQYWFPVLFGAPALLDKNGLILEARDQHVRKLRLVEGEDPLLVGAILAGKLGFAWWSAIGDDFHFNLDEADVARRLAFTVRGSKALAELSEEVKRAGRSKAFVSTGEKCIVNVRWNAARDVTDRFDREVLHVAGLGGYWRALNIWYRQSMRSTKESNGNSRYLTPEETNEFLGW